MSELLTKWINRDVQLSIGVQSFEDDFANGYFLGELLLRLKMIPLRDFEVHFRDDDHPKALVANFAYLEQSLKPMGIDLTHQNVTDIMSSKPGATLRLIYQIKMAITKMAGRATAKSKPNTYDRKCRYFIDAFFIA